MELKAVARILQRADSGVTDMSVEDETIRALAKAMRVMMTASHDMPIQIQAALLRLAAADWQEQRQASPSLGAEPGSMEHVDGDGQQAQEAHLAG